MNSLFDQIYNSKMSALTEVVTQSQNKDIIDDLNAKLASLPPAERGNIADLLTSLQNVGGRLVPNTKKAESGELTGKLATGSTQTMADMENPAAAGVTKPEPVKPPTPEETKQKTAQNVALAQAKQAGDQAAGYAKG